MPSIFSLIGDLLKKKPDVPEITPIDPNEEALQAIEGNIANLPRIRDLASQLNRYQRDEFNKLLPPGARQSIEGNILSALRGEIPGDVSNMIERRSAEMASAGGFSGSIFGRNLTLRDLGLTSLARSDMGLDMAARWLSMEPPQFNFASMFVTPDMQIQQANIDRDATFQRNWMSNQLDAAYDPWTIVGENTIKYDEQMSAWADMAVASYLGTSVPSYGGGGGGGGGDGGGGGGMMGGGGGFDIGSIMGMFGGGGGGGGGAAAGAGAAAAFSDVNFKKNFEPVNEDEIADQLAELDVSRWHYKNEGDDSTKHIGPMAQDFNPTFMGKEDLQIQFQDAIGVLLAAVKSLSKRVKELENG